MENRAPIAPNSITKLPDSKITNSVYAFAAASTALVSIGMPGPMLELR